MEQKRQTPKAPVENEEKSFEDKVAEAEKEYQEFKKLNIDCKEFGVMI